MAKGSMPNPKPEEGRVKVTGDTVKKDDRIWLPKGGWRDAEESDIGMDVKNFFCVTRKD